MENNTPLVSVVVPLFNKERHVERAIRSVLAQTVEDFELIIVNDGSTDNGPLVARSFKDHRIRVIDQPNVGVSAARNRGIEEAKTDLMAFLDADDEWSLDFLETIMALRSRYLTCDVFGTGYYFSSSSGQRRAAVIRGIPHERWEGIVADYFSVASKSDPPLCASAVATTKKAIESVGGFPLGVTAGEDLLTWARLATKFQMAYSTKPRSIHYNPRDVSERPGLIPQEPDIVGDALRELLSSVDLATIPGLKAYIALWHRMRAVIFIQLGDRRNTLKEIKNAMMFSPSLRLALLLLLARFPGALPAKTLMAIKRLKASF